MNKKTVKRENQNGISSKKIDARSKTISYRLKCEKTANGLSHFVMYGDVDRKKALL